MSYPLRVQRVSESLPGFVLLIAGIGLGYLIGRYS